MIVGIQPISSIPLYRGELTPWLDRHAGALNAQTEALCAEIPHTAFAPLSAPPRAEVAWNSSTWGSGSPTRTTGRCGT